VAGRPFLSEPMSFSFSGKYRFGEYAASVEVASGPGGNELFIAGESVKVGEEVELRRDSQGGVKFVFPLSSATLDWRAIFPQLPLRSTMAGQ